MILPRARILRAPVDAATLASTGGSPGTVPPQGRRLDRKVVDATEQAARVVDAAMRRASGILADAERSAAEIRERAERSAVEIRELAAAEGRAEGLASVAALALSLREREARADESAVDRAVDLAKLLAERLLGHALSIDPTRITALAKQALTEAGGARRIELHAHPADTGELESALASFDPGGRVHRVVADPALARGDIRLHTEFGMIDARLGPELGRLAERLRTALTR